MKTLKESLLDSNIQTMESLFDKNIIKKDPINFSEFERLCKRPATRADMFKIIMAVMNTPKNYMPGWYTTTYEEHRNVIDYIILTLQDQFKKQSICTWFDVKDNDFEEAGDEMTEEEIDEANAWLGDFFSRAVEDDCGCKFKICKGKIPEFLKNILKNTGYWFDKLNQLDTWAVGYHTYYTNGEQVLSFYGCPKGLDPVVKKLLYD
jgi:hypothetical protein